jgi:transcriptional regulator with PAS, ATPase and Fis domain
MEVAPDVKAILDCLQEPAILLNDEYRILMANEAYEARYGDGRRLRRRHCYEVSHRYQVPCDLAGEQCPLKHSRETGQPTRVLHVHHTPRGQEYVNVETLPIRGDDGSISHYIEVMRPSTIAATRGDHDGLVGVSKAFQVMVAAIDRVAPTETSVLLLGESGTGKEVAARTIHDRSARADGPFVPVECAGLAESLFESELFGHTKGAFTGASSEKIGLVEAAKGGTLFLDEIGEITMAEQVKLLRLLETRQFRRVGSTDAREADFRLVCATNTDLESMVADGTFREDLYYRINVFEIPLPPLRKRGDDLPLLVEALLKRMNSAKRVSDEVLVQLGQHPFPGNIRELRNVLERALLMCDGDTILPDHLPARIRPGNTAAAESARFGEIKPLADIEQDYLRHAIATFDGDRKTLAARLGLSERALYRKLAALKSTTKPTA